MTGNPLGQTTVSGRTHAHSNADSKGPCSWCGHAEGDVVCSDQCAHEREAARSRGWLRPLVACEPVGTTHLLAAFWEQHAHRLRLHRREELQFLLSDQFVAWCDLDGYGRVADRRARFLGMWTVTFGDEDLLQRTPCRTCGTTNIGDFWQGEEWDERPYCKECEKEQKRQAKERR